MHNAAHPAHEQPQHNVTHDDVNAALHKVGRAPLTADQFSTLCKQSQGHLKLALQELSTNAQALTWVLTNAGVLSDSKPAPINQSQLNREQQASSTSHGQEGQRQPSSVPSSQASRFPESGGGNGEREYGRQCHVYMGDALCFQQTRTKGTKRSGDYRPAFDTISIDFAKSLGPKKYDWNNKMIFQFTEKELPGFIAVLMGWAPAVEFKGHGPDKNKGIKVHHQGTKVYIQGYTKGFSVGVPVAVDTLTMVTALCWEQLIKTHPAVAQAGLLHEVVRNTAGRVLANAAG